VKGDLYDIARRIKSIEKGYFIVFNKRAKKFEVHSTWNVGNTYCFTVPYSRLDYRTIELCKETNLAIHGDQIEKRIESDNAKLERKMEKEYRAYLDDAGFETADRVAFAVDEDDLHKGYTKTHHMGGGETK
jgi:hypothetical protein